MSGAIKPQVADWNGDGLDDLLIGDGEGHVNYFKRLPDGRLTEMPDLEANGEVINSGGTSALSAPLITDWNNDGLLDLVLGATPRPYGDGIIRIYLNKGSPGNPVLTDYSVMTCGNDTISYMHIQPEFEDLNMDGLSDLIVSQYYSTILYYENAGTSQEPVFDTAVILDVPSLADWPVNRSVCVYDWEKNGTPDLLIGDYQSNIYLYINKMPVKINEKTSISDSDLLRSLKIFRLYKSIRVSLTTSSSCPITIGLYTTAGSKVKTVNNNNAVKAVHDIVINCSDVSPGVYLIKCIVGYEKAASKIILY